MDKISWGILATGNIANNIAQALSNMPDARMVAVASRTQEKADAFGEKWKIPKRYNTYEALAHDPDVQVIYIASPHNHHYENMRMCLAAGKHVLCEKPLTLNAQQAEACIRLSREKNLFLMEAMWMRFFPAMAHIRAWLEAGRIGDIRLIQADFCINVPFDAAHRLYNPALGGGALLDLGIYPISFAAMALALDQVESVRSFAHLGATGVDEWDNLILAYKTGASAALSCGFHAYKPREAFIVGTQGYIKVHNIFFRPDDVTLHLSGEEPQVLHFPFRDNGYTHELQEVHDCLRANQLESKIMPLAETVQIMRFMDQLRDAWGIVYPDEHK